MLKIQETENTSVINVNQERLDISIAKKMLDSLQDVLGGSHKEIIVNLRLVNYMDSSVLGVLVNFQKSVKDQGKNLVITGLSPSIRKIFELTKLDRFFEIRDL